MRIAAGLISISAAMALVAPFALRGAPPHADPAHCFKIKVIDAATGRGVPMVELRTTNDVRWYTDSNGIAAFDDEGLIGKRVFFFVSSPGYSYPKDGFGYAGTALDTKAGGSAEIKVTRENIAERLYRITGEGIYRDSLIAGEPAPLRDPQFAGQVMGQDTVEVTPYHGKLYWFWGDTGRPGYPLGNFHTSGATSRPPSAGGLDPSKGIDLTYFTDETGFCKGMLPSDKPGPVWVGGLCTVKDASGAERLICNYARMESLSHPVERGLAQFNDAKQLFEPIATLDIKAPQCPLGHPFHGRAVGVEYIYSAIAESDPLPCARVKAQLEQLKDANAYEYYTYLAPGAVFQGAETRLDRDSEGRIRYGWKQRTACLTWKQESELVRDGKLKPDEALIQLCDSDTGKRIQPAGGSVYWNAYRNRWVMIFGQFGGTTSLLGEIWYAEADTPVGPWVYARKVVTHNNYSFYNPTQDTFFDAADGRQIYFEGTYTHTFSDNKDITPRYDYNQMMYRLSLDDPKLTLPAAVYESVSGAGAVRYELGNAASGDSDVKRIAFFAVPPDEAHAGLIPIFMVRSGAGYALTSSAQHVVAGPLFYGAPIAGERPDSAVLTALYEFTAAGKRVYSTKELVEGYTRSVEPVCRVWRSPISTLPLDWQTVASEAHR